MLSNSSLDMLSESLTYVICKTVRYFDNDVLRIYQLHAYMLANGAD